MPKLSNVLLLLSLAGSSAFSYDPSVGREMTLLAESAYCDADTIASWSCGSCQLSMDSVTIIENSNKNLQGYVGLVSGSSAVVVSFRGTEDVHNWVQDLDAVKISPYADYPDVAVHKGFYNDWIALKLDVYYAMKSLGVSNTSTSVPLWVTGHSLGGALGELAAFDMIRDNYDIDRVVTLGTPRPGDAQWGTTYHSLLGNINTRLVHHHDIVPHVPPEAMGFRHSTTEIYYTTDSDYTVCSTTDGEDKDCSDGNVENLSVDDHLDYLGIAMGQSGCCVTGC